MSRNHQLSHCIAWSYHVDSGHATFETLRSDLRMRGYYIIASKAFTKSLVSTCWKCRGESVHVSSQKLAPLPLQRVTRSFAFQFVGLDFFGHFRVKQGRRYVKRYCCIFVCCTTRAVHLEVVWDLTTDAFLCCLCRFISRRGFPAIVFSDNGTNLKGADNYFKELD